MSYGDSNPRLSDRAKYPYFYRTVPSETDFNVARVKLLRQFNWNRVGTLFQDASSGIDKHSLIHSNLTEMLDRMDIERQTESFSTDPRTALENLKTTRQVNRQTERNDREENKMTDRGEQTKRNRQRNIHSDRQAKQAVDNSDNKQQ
ncbi:hypothetical protein HELRODRAFT_164599 [Helobdella robusta]|uniref:Receptor ligand binding region domain-containing protein n=1 Tax=Helobdella robusta TaxID=6412 RepID=T1EVM3_HELRO|nr:hypothetical protein HELRODRAFT_164599 [Helobdella robusta]ESN94712.1 hypothetical protein HELRODRAFT_164599 [Helobdella robusta]